MAKSLTWYQKGFDEAVEGLPSDPPMHPSHGSYRNYMDGYRDGERQAELDADHRATADCGSAA